MKVQCQGRSKTRPVWRTIHLLRREVPLTRRSVAYFCCGAHKLYFLEFIDGAGRGANLSRCCKDVSCSFHNRQNRSNRQNRNLQAQSGHNDLVSPGNDSSETALFSILFPPTIEGGLARFLVSKLEISITLNSCKVRILRFSSNSLFSTIRTFRRKSWLPGFTFRRRRSRSL